MGYWQDYKSVWTWPRPPPKSVREAEAANVHNPLSIIMSLTWMQHAQFFAGLLAWTCDAYDYFTVALSVNRLSETFYGDTSPQTTHQISQSITLTLLFRSVGALTVGVISDGYGRRLPLVINLLVIAVLQIGTSFCTTYNSFLAVRCLFGIAMGAVWGVAASSALESIPMQARGLFSGIFQQGWAIGYLFAAIVNIFGVADLDDWRLLFWVGAGITFFAAVFRFCLPESEFFKRAAAEEKANGVHRTGFQKSKTFAISCWEALKFYWIRFVYAVLLMSWFNFFSHGSQDLLPTMMENAKLLSSHDATLVTIIANLGAIVGGTITGFVSQFGGRRLTIIACCIWTACFIPLWILPDNFSGLAAGAFMIQVGVQGAWGIIPIYLSEISPPAFRAVFSGLSYQLGNAVSSASSQMEATAGETWKTTANNGEIVPNYAGVMGLIIGIVIALILIWMFIGPEFHGTHFEEGKTAMQAGGGAQDASELTGARHRAHDMESSSTLDHSGFKGDDAHHEHSGRKPSQGTFVGQAIPEEKESKA